MILLCPHQEWTFFCYFFLVISTIAIVTTTKSRDFFLNIFSAISPFPPTILGTGSNFQIGSLWRSWNLRCRHGDLKFFTMFITTFRIHRRYFLRQISWVGETDPISVPFHSIINRIWKLNLLDTNDKKLSLFINSTMSMLGLGTQMRLKKSTRCR